MSSGKIIICNILSKNVTKKIKWDNENSLTINVSKSKMSALLHFSASMAI